MKRVSVGLWGLSLGVLLAHGVATNVYAQQPVNSATGVALFSGGSVVRSRVERRSAESESKRVEVTRVPTTLSYGLAPDTTLSLTVPWLSKESRINSGGGPVTERVSGLGDLLVTAKHRYMTRNYRGGSTQLAVLGGIKLPTGDTGASAGDGSRLPIPAQLGSGSLDFIAALTATRIFAYDWATHASILYKYNREGDRDFRFGDFINMNLAISRLVYRQPYPGPEAYLGLELNAEYSRRHELNSDPLPNSGGYRLFLSPTFVAFLARNWTLEASVQIPVEQNLKGQQLKEDTRFVLGLRFQYGAFF